MQELQQGYAVELDRKLELTKALYTNTSNSSTTDSSNSIEQIHR